MSRSLRVLVLAVAAVALAAPAARADGPAAQLNAHIERVFETLKQVPEPQRQAEVRRIAFEIFDFNETARRALGRHWTERTDGDRERFVRAFTALIDHAYLSRVDRYNGEYTVVVVGDAVQGDEATVRTRVVGKDGSEMGVDYRMLRAGGDERWRVWDVSIGGMSLVSSYRAQFNKIIQVSSWDELVKRLEGKAAQ